MKNISVVYIILTLFLYNCSNKEVQLPIIDIEGIHEIQNHSSIWIFFENKGQDTLAILNKNNKLLNTHWIFNIDKRLTMNQVIPILEKMQENRNKDSMHKKEGMLNYFSYADITTNNISLIEFYPTEYIYSETKYEAILDKLQFNQILEIELNNDKLYLNKTESLMNQLNQKIDEHTKNNSLSKPIIIFKYGNKTSYQKYLNIKTILTKTNVEVINIEYIFNFN